MTVDKRENAFAIFMLFVSAAFYFPFRALGFPWYFALIYSLLSFNPLADLVMTMPLVISCAPYVRGESVIIDPAVYWISFAICVLHLFHTIWLLMIGPAVDKHKQKRRKKAS